MEYINNNPIEEETFVETPVFEAPVVTEPVVEHIVETPVVEEAAQAVVEAPAYQAPEEVQALGSVADGVIGATTAPKEFKKPAKKTSESKKETIALYSTKNVTWSEVGKVYRGYNIVEKDAAEKWLTRPHIRIATPEEVAKEFGK
jgi:hypothetical protein